MVTAIRNPDYIRSEKCDYADEDGERCHSSPAGYIGDIYYACEEHTEDMCDWLED